MLTLLFPSHLLVVSRSVNSNVAVALLSSRKKVGSPITVGGLTSVCVCVVGSDPVLHVLSHPPHVCISVSATRPVLPLFIFFFIWGTSFLETVK